MRRRFFSLGVLGELGLRRRKREEKKRRRRKKKEEEKKRKIQVWKLILVSLELMFGTLVWNISFVWNSCICKYGTYFYGFVG